MTDYKEIPIYDRVNWNLTSEACHILLLAPSGQGKSIYLSYLAAMALKRGHELYVIDAKNTSFGASYRAAGISVASKPDEIITMLSKLVDFMEEDYDKYFSSDKVSLDANFAKLNLPAHILIFDEVLSALNSGDKKDKAEMERLLKILALKGRMAGYVLVLTAQRLLSTDLPKAITEQCQTRFIMGANVSDELFHLTTGFYKRDLATGYKGAVGKGYAVTPKIGLTYFEAPYIDFSKNNFIVTLRAMRKGGDY